MLRPVIWIFDTDVKFRVFTCLAADVDLQYLASRIHHSHTHKMKTSARVNTLQSRRGCLCLARRPARATALVVQANLIEDIGSGVGSMP
jgi:hypothetical protein